MKEQKKLLIFAMYIPIGSYSEQVTKTRLKDLREMMMPKFKSMEERTGNIMELFIFPTREGPTKMECVYSGDINSEGIALDKDLIDLSSNFYDSLKRGDK